MNGALLMMVGGVLMMAPLRRIVFVRPLPGNELREAYKAPTMEPVPDDLMALTHRIPGPLRVVGGKDRP